MRITWPCKDGYVNFQFSGGAGAGRSVNNFVRWMAEEGLGDDYLEGLDFTQLGYGMITQDMLQRVVPPVERFMRSHTKQELFDGAVSRRILLFPVATPHDILDNPQLAARQYYRHVTHPQLDTPVTFLGPFVQASATPLQWQRFPPTLGEHNSAIYIDELGLSRQELAQLREAAAI
jgi:crotonobetainyl-CoA:carnitine CoA-transferase CaiB-like acyl-CoA transferase